MHKIMIKGQDIEKVQSKSVSDPMLERLKEIFKDDSVSIFGKMDFIKADLSKEEATLHQTPDNCSITEIPSQDEFGILVENGYSYYGGYYVGPFSTSEAAEERAKRMLEDDYILAGTQAFIIKDVKLFRKTFVDAKS